MERGQSSIQIGADALYMAGVSKRVRAGDKEALQSAPCTVDSGNLNPQKVASMRLGINWNKNRGALKENLAHCGWTKSCTTQETLESRVIALQIPTNNSIHSMRIPTTPFPQCDWDPRADDRAPALLEAQTGMTFRSAFGALGLLAAFICFCFFHEATRLNKKWERRQAMAKMPSNSSWREKRG